MTGKTPAPWTAVPVPPQVPAFAGYADLEPVKLWYWDTGGDGEVIVLNHPWSQASECWPYQQPVFAKTGYRVIAWSRRGAGKTERGPMDNLGTSAEDQKRLLDHLGIDKVHMVGCAAGGVTSINFALENPDRILSLVLSGTVLLPDEEEFRDMRSRIMVPRDHGATTAYMEIGPSYRAGNPDGVKAWAKLEHEARPNGLFSGQPWGASPVTWARTEKFNKPVLLLTGDADYGSSAALKRMFATHFPDRELAVIDEAGHAAYWEQPEAFNAVVLDFIARNSAKGPRKAPPKRAATAQPWLTAPSSEAPTPAIITGPVEVWKKIPIPAQVPAMEGYADTSPVKIWYWDTGGAGQPIVLCHPWSQSSECWKYQQPVFAKAGYRVIGWSQRGFYKTDKGPEDNPGSVADDLRQLVDFLKLDRFHLIGCAAGGVSAISYALNHPEKLRSLILSGSILLPDEPENKQFRDNLAAAAPGVKTNIPVAHREVGASYRAGNAEGFAAWMELEHRAHPAGWHTSQPWGSERNWKTFSTLNVPILLQTGDTDMSSPPSLQRLFAPHFPNCELRVIKEAGHNAYWEQPEAFNASTLEFIGRHAK
jgi:pimeloyl-ACP methyl ester carboxylesterase